MDLVAALFGRQDVAEEQRIYVYTASGEEKFYYNAQVCTVLACTYV